MNSCLWLERPGIWRVAATGIILAILTVPMWLLFAPSRSADTLSAITPSFAQALFNSVIVAVATAAVALATGWPLGTAAALFDFRGRRWLIAAAAFPLVVPTFLWAIGWSMFAVRWPILLGWLTTGYLACSLSFAPPAIALTFFASFASTTALAQSQLDAARLAGGERTVFIQACRSAAIPAALSAALAAVLSLSDPGPGQIFSVRTGASEILVSFAALYDFDLAARQCLALAGIVVVVTLPLAIAVVPRVASATMAKQLRIATPTPSAVWGRRTACALSSVLFAFVVLPLTALFMPLATSTELGRAWSEVTRTAIDTICYGLAAGVFAATFGFALAISVGRSTRLLNFALSAGFVLFSLPAALGALGFVFVATNASANWDFLLRGRPIVAVALALRLVPVAALLAIRAWQATAPSWTFAAAIHGVPLSRFAWMVLARILARSFGLCVLLVALLATADVSTVLLLHPPGSASLPLSIFTVMANAPESLVASLCLVYVIAASCSLAGVVILARRFVP